MISYTSMAIRERAIEILRNTAGVMTMAAAVAQAQREAGLTAVVRVTTQSTVTGKVRRGYYRAGWTDNNLPRVGSKAQTLVMDPETANTIRANVQNRIDANGGAVWATRSTSIIGIDVEIVR